jgi:hypothetical protein
MIFLDNVVFVIGWRTGEGNQRGVNGSQSKFLKEVFAYIPKSTQRISLLEWSKSHSYSEAIGPWKRDRNWNHTESTPRCKKSHKRWPKLNQQSLTASPIIPRTSCGRDRETTIRVQWKLRKLEPLIRWLMNKTGTELLTKAHYKNHK